MPSDWAFVSVDMELTNKCNSDCLMCPRDAITRPKGMMSEDVFKAVSEKLVSEGSLIAFSGMGDPLSHPNVFEWICDTRRKGGDVGIITCMLVMMALPFSTLQWPTDFFKRFGK